VNLDDTESERSVAPANATGALRRALDLLREPVPAEKRRLLAERWDALDPALRYPIQGFGQQATGCGATIGAYPKCDFDCQGCYLGAEANAVPRFALADVFAQLEQLRRWLGPKGNVQITDGEVTLLPERDLLAILRRSRELGLIPMVMSHGDTFRRKPELLPLLVAEGGLREVSIHVDSTQRGRRGWKGGADEIALMPLRDELAELVRETRRRTGVRLRAATTVTVTRDNLAAIPAVVEWCLRNRDAFQLVSFQPLARVGRTRDHLRGVDAAELWREIGTALGPYGFAAEERSPLQFGHVDCTRMEPLLVLEPRVGDTAGVPRLVQVVRPGRADDEAVVRGFLERGLGGLNFRDDTLPERLCRGAGVLLSDLRFFAGPVRRWATARAAELGVSLTRLAGGAALGRVRVDSFMVVSHHFMSAEEVASERGRQRLSACVFRLAIDGEMVPMCRVNATGVREAVYARGATAAAEARQPA
jgi:hypothetical protein